MTADTITRSGWLLDPKTTMLMVAAFALMIATGLLTHRRFAAFEESSRWVAHTHEVLTNVSEIESSLLDAESGQRGYLLTGEEPYLQPYHASLANIPQELTQLREHTVDNATQQRLLDALEPLVTRRLALAAEMIGLKAQGRDVPAELMAEGRRVMGEIRGVLQQLKDEERRLLASRLEVAAATERTTNLAVAGATVLDMVALTLAVLLVNRNIAGRSAVERAVRRAHDELELRVRERTAELARTNEGLRQEVEERRRAEQALQESEERYRRLVDLNPDGIRIYRDGKIVFTNAADLKLFGAERPEQLIGKSVFDFIGSEHNARVAERFRRLEEVGEAVPFVEEKLFRLDGTTFDAEVGAAPFPDQGGRSALVIFRDVSRRKRLEEQLRQAQKMEAVGQLAGGVAHDFNNLLTVISGYSEMVAATLPAGDRNRDLIQEIYKAGERAAQLTRQLLAFSRKQVIDPRVLDLNAVVAEAGKMLRRLIGEDVALMTVLAPELARVKADPGQVEQVVMNLAVNARDAMPQGGKLTIETANAELDEQYAQTPPGVRPGRYVMLAVRDTGHGMDEATRAHIFEPFFTTKGPGKGTGLGLATVYGIVTQAGGHIDVESEPGRGTTFKIYLPAVEDRASADNRDPGLRGALHGTETVLLVEDEPGVRTLGRMALQMYGYTVLEAGVGEEAVRVGRQHLGPIHLLLTDVVMPGMSGRQVAEALRALHPAIKVLFVSGYTDDAVVQHGILAAETAFLQKPFTPVALTTKVREVLDGSQPSTGQPAASGE